MPVRRDLMASVAVAIVIMAHFVPGALARQISIEQVFVDSYVTALNSNASGTVFAGFWDGLVFSSNDDGATWTEVFNSAEGDPPRILDLEPVGDDSLIVVHSTEILKLDLSTSQIDTLGSSGADVALAADGSIITVKPEGIVRGNPSGYEYVVVGDVDLCDGTLRIVTSSANPQTHFAFQTCGPENSGGNLFRSTNDGLSWEVLRETLGFYDVHELSSGRLLLAGQWGIGFSNDSAATITKSMEGDGPYTDILSISDGTLFSVDGNGNVRRSIDGGQSWTWDGTTVPNVVYAPQSLVVNDYLFFGTPEGAFRTVDPVSTGTLSTSEVPNSLYPEIFPNPAGSFVHVRVPPGTERSTEISLVDMLGRTRNRIVAGCCLDGVITLKTSELSPGLYLISISMRQGVFSKPVVISR